MNDEIKEILDFKENADYKRLSCDETAILKDYITNLQQENKELKDEIIRQSKAQVILDNENTELQDYKSRTEKAVEYIENHQLVFELSSLVQIKEWFDMFYKDTLNILNGRSDE